jgi:hypothetical protein
MGIKIERIKKSYYDSSASGIDEVGYLVLGDENGKSRIEYFRKHGNGSVPYFQAVKEMKENGAEPLIIFDCGKLSKLPELKKKYDRKPIKEVRGSLERTLLPRY